MEEVEAALLKWRPNLKIEKKHWKELIYTDVDGTPEEVIQTIKRAIEKEDDTWINPRNDKWENSLLIKGDTKIEGFCYVVMDPGSAYKHFI
jgi:hypothetical protein